MFLNRHALLAASTILICTSAILYQLQQKRKRFRKYKTRVINRRRTKTGFYKSYFLKMKLLDEESFFKYTRMNVKIFDKLLSMIAPKIQKRNLPDGICPEERLAVTLHYLSQGSSMQTIAWKYNMGLTTVHSIILETATALWEALHTIYLKPPNSQPEWLNIADEFQQEWNFPNCIGAINGKHIAIHAPRNTGSMYFNYKKTFSIVLLASCNAHYLFTLVDIGGYGSQSDGGIFKNSIFGTMLEGNKLKVPQPSISHSTNILQPYVFVADAAFPLKNYLMRPYPGNNLSRSQRIFNYRLSRARCVIENAFGILVNRWRILKTTINADVHNVECFVKAIVCLHNYIKLESVKCNDNSYCPSTFVDGDAHSGTWRLDVDPLTSVGKVASNRAANDVYLIRDRLKDYFCAEGAIPWQDTVINEGFYPTV